MKRAMKYVLRALLVVLMLFFERCSVVAVEPPVPVIYEGQALTSFPHTYQIALLVPVERVLPFFNALETLNHDQTNTLWQIVKRVRIFGRKFGPTHPIGMRQLQRLAYSPGMPFVLLDNCNLTRCYRALPHLQEQRASSPIIKLQRLQNGSLRTASALSINEQLFYGPRFTLARVLQTQVWPERIDLIVPVDQIMPFFTELRGLHSMLGIASPEVDVLMRRIARVDIFGRSATSRRQDDYTLTHSDAVCFPFKELRLYNCNMATRQNRFLSLLWRGANIRTVRIVIHSADCNSLENGFLQPFTRCSFVAIFGCSLKFAAFNGVYTSSSGMSVVTPNCVWCYENRMAPGFPVWQQQHMQRATGTAWAGVTAGVNIEGWMPEEEARGVIPDEEAEMVIPDEEAREEMYEEEAEEVIPEEEAEIVIPDERIPVV